MMTVRRQTASSAKECGQHPFQPRQSFLQTFSCGCVRQECALARLGAVICVSGFWSFGSLAKVHAKRGGMTTNPGLEEQKRWTIGEQMLQQRAHQARIRLESEIREQARKRGASLAEAAEVARQSRAVFAIVNGEPVAMAADGKTPLAGEDGTVRLSVRDWVARQVPDAPPTPTLGPTVAPLPPVQRNPWRKESWNLTEQMRLLRRDPELARRFRDEAAA